MKQNCRNCLGNIICGPWRVALDARMDMERKIEEIKPKYIEMFIKNKRKTNYPELFLTVNTLGEALAKDCRSFIIRSIGE